MDKLFAPVSVPRVFSCKTPPKSVRPPAQLDLRSQPADTASLGVLETLKHTGTNWSVTTSVSTLATTSTQITPPTSVYPLVLHPNSTSQIPSQEIVFSSVLMATSPKTLLAPVQPPALLAMLTT